MDINQYDIYEKESIALAKSIVIKSDRVAEIINQGLIENGFFDISDDKRTWKYYMNVNGQYHPSDPEPFIIISKDTLKPIAFTKDNLYHHPATASAYKKGSVDYAIMVSRYPEYEMLIQGICDPVDMELAIESKEYTILSWDKTLVEKNEYGLIDALQQFSNTFFLNYHNSSYSLVDNLYITSVLAVYYIHLPNAILNSRLNNCHTSQAHSFHIWAYLSSYGHLDKWRNVLDEYQIHYLYRNIRYINDNAGQTAIFNNLVNVLLSRQRFPLYGYDLRHIISDIDNQLVPESKAVRFRIDEKVNVANFTETKNISTIIDDTLSCAKDNAIVRDSAIDNTILKMIKSNKDWLTTKVLECELVNELENIPLQVRYIAYNHWVYLCANGYYQAGVHVDFPPSDIAVDLTAKDALILHYYCSAKLFGYTPERIPKLSCLHVKKITNPTKEVLIAINGEQRLSDAWITDLLKRQWALTPIESVNEFTQLCYAIRELDFDDKCQTSAFYTLYDNAIAKLMTDAFWTNAIVDISDETYSDYFSRTSINPDTITQSLALELANTVYHNITGFDPRDLGKSTLLEALISLLAFLSSYSIQIIESDKYSKIMAVNWCYTKVDIIGIYAVSLPIKVRLAINTLINQWVRAINHYFLPMPIIMITTKEHTVYDKTLLNTLVTLSTCSIHQSMTVCINDSLRLSIVGVL